MQYSFYSCSNHFSVGIPVKNLQKLNDHEPVIHLTTMKNHRQSNAVFALKYFGL